METHIRPAVASDARHLFDIRRDSILELAPPAMPVELAGEWANAHPPDWIYDVLRERDVWVLVFENQIVAGSAQRPTISTGCIRGRRTSAPGLVLDYFDSRRLSFAAVASPRRRCTEATMPSSSTDEQGMRLPGRIPSRTAHSMRDSR